VRHGVGGLPDRDRDVVRCGRSVSGRSLWFEDCDQYSWPPQVELGQQWPTIYADAAQDLDVLADVNEAVAWVNDLVDRIETAR
jgi:hypothetical protein